jgi:hypothetical protein
LLFWKKREKIRFLAQYLLLYRVKEKRKKADSHSLLISEISLWELEISSKHRKSPKQREKNI